MMMASHEDAKARKKDPASIPRGGEFRRLIYTGTVVSGAGFPHEYQTLMLFTNGAMKTEKIQDARLCPYACGLNFFVDKSDRRCCAGC